MHSASAPFLSSTYEPTLGDVLRDLWRARFYLLAGVVIGLTGASLFLAAAVPQHRATMLVAPTTRSGTPDISALFPNNASFAMEYVMQSFGPGDSSDFMRFETILREASIADRLLRDEKIRTGLAKAQHYKFSAVADTDNSSKLAAWLQKNIAVEPVGQTRLKRVSLLHPDPAFAVYMLQQMYGITDGMIRAELEDKTAKRINYLTGELDKISNPEHRRILTKLLMDQEQINMILAVNEPYAAAIAEPPAAAPKPTWPRKSLVLPAFVFTGFFAGYIVYMLRRPTQK